VKAFFSVTLIVPAELTAISNMPAIKTVHLKDGKKKIAFDQSPKMSTYLLAWAVGEFDRVFIYLFIYLFIYSFMCVYLFIYLYVSISLYVYIYIYL
jgi:aminopeptidase N